jgi:ATP-dependent DNA helicase RecG
MAGVELADLASDALARYRERTRIPDKTMSAAFLQRLERQGLLRRRGSKLVPTGFGFLLFGRSPRDVLHHAGLNATLQYPDGSNEIHNFDAPAILVPELVEQWLRPRLPNVIDRSRMTREERTALPFELVREGVINALVHRDYDLTGATCHLVVTPDMVTVKSPGAPLAPVTLEQLQSFTAPMYNRNPKLQFAFGGTKLVEGRGFGMRTFGAAAAKHGLPLPKYAWEAPYLALTIYRTLESSILDLKPSVRVVLSDEELRGWTFLATRSGASQSEYARQMEVTARTAQRHLTHFVELGLLRRVGRGPATEYRKPQYLQP